MRIAKFTVNPFQENSSVLYDETGECAIVDPGFSNAEERDALVKFIESKKLKPVLVLNTHCHIDHILGNRFVADKYKLGLHIHRADEPVLKSGNTVASMYGIDYDTSPEPSAYLNEGENIKFGNTELEVFHLPGHAPGHVIFVHRPTKVIIGGDVIFDGSIGRTDLPGGNHDELLNSIRTKLFTLPDDFVVYPGHGPETTVGKEKATNPFFRN